MIFPTPHPLHILRVGIAITFFWIGVLILQDPVAWGAFIKPEFRALIPGTIRQAMLATAWLDIGIGALLLFSTGPRATWIASLLASLHMVVVLAVAGIDPVTVRDLAILAGSLALLSWSWPAGVWPASPPASLSRGESRGRTHERGS